MFNTFTEPLRSQEVFQKLEAKLRKNRGLLMVSGCIESQKANLAYALAGEDFRAVIIAENDLKARAFYEDYRFYHENTYFYPAKDLLFYQADVRSGLMDSERVAALRAVLSDPKAALVLSMPSLMDPVTPADLFRRSIMTIRKGGETDLTHMTEILSSIGYERSSLVSMPGQFAVRGDILDIYSVTQEQPFRIELFGDTVESIRCFDPESQLKVSEEEEAVIFPANDHAAAKDTILSYFDNEQTVFFLDDPNRLVDGAHATEDEFRESVENRISQGTYEEGMIPDIFGAEEIIARLNRLDCVALCAIPAAAGTWEVRGQFSISAQAVSSYNNSFEYLVKDLGRYKKNGYRAAVMTVSATRARRMAQELRDAGISAFCTDDTDRILEKGEVLVAAGHAARGFEYPLSGFVLISEQDIFGKKAHRKKRRTEYSGKKIATFSELSCGDYVVHESHGLGIYRGLEKIRVDGVMKDYMKIEYDGSNLYVLATQLDTLQKYAGADAGTPRLNKLGGQAWKQTKSRVRSAVRDIARELVALYAARQDGEGFVYGRDTVWQKEFEEMFPYEETEDQIAAIEDTKRDMESTKIMDRLICGDVGYGKTEVALRAAFKAVQDNKQVAFLVPTTILAQQHYNTFLERMKDFPVRVDLLCRFRTKAQQEQTLKDLKAGLVDVVIGTHRLLSKDVRFKDLGLLVIDEEQRFGVTHKEKIKQLRKNVDVLTLTATPIPRTLHMSLIGIRDMSVLEEPPQDRVPIQTYVCEYNQEIVREAVSRELARDGQVYYVYNRVADIAEMARRISSLVPEASVAYADGQMREQELERVMVDFINHDIDVLVTTTIIETGLDIPNVNTMIIHDADRYGLSQLYQLRGRVGRSNRTAYAFLMYRRDRMLKEVAEKRLAAIREFTELGSGIKIAMRDLEIRGAGNLLGAEQHGFMDAVGYDLYCKMLSQAVAAEKGIAQPEDDFETVVDLPVNAYIPPDYIPDEFQKLDAYKKIAGIEDRKDCADMEDELTDRYGKMPEAVQNLLLIAYIKACAHKASITEIKRRDKEIAMAILPQPSFDPVRLPEVLSKFRGKIRFRKYKSGSFFLCDAGENMKASAELIRRFTEMLAGVTETGYNTDLNLTRRRIR